MKRREVIGLQQPTPEKLEWLDRQVIDRMSSEQAGLLAQILQTLPALSMPSRQGARG
jgi:hypothetical protein